MKLTVRRAANAQRSARTMWSAWGSWTDFCKEKMKMSRSKFVEVT